MEAISTSTETNTKAKSKLNPGHPYNLTAPSKKELTEVEECKLFLQLLPQKYKDKLIHIPNEGKRSLGYAKTLKAIGLRTGCSDYFLAIPSGKYHGLWLEMKAINGKASPAQEDFIKLMRESGYAAYLVKGGENAARLVTLYMTNKI